MNAGDTGQVQPGCHRTGAAKHGPMLAFRALQVSARRGLKLRGAKEAGLASVASQSSSSQPSELLLDRSSGLGELRSGFWICEKGEEGHRPSCGSDHPLWMMVRCRTVCRVGVSVGSAPVHEFGG